MNDKDRQISLFQHGFVANYGNAQSKGSSINHQFTY